MKKRSSPKRTLPRNPLEAFREGDYRLYKPDPPVIERGRGLMWTSLDRPRRRKGYRLITGTPTPDCGIMSAIIFHSVEHPGDPIRVLITGRPNRYTEILEQRILPDIENVVEIEYITTHHAIIEAMRYAISFTDPRAWAYEMDLVFLALRSGIEAFTFARNWPPDPVIWPWHVAIKDRPDPVEFFEKFPEDQDRLTRYIKEVIDNV